MKSDMRRILAHLYEALIRARLDIERADEHSAAARRIIAGGCRG